MRVSHWLMVAGLVAPLFACSAGGDGGGDGGAAGSVVGGSGGGVVGGSAGAAGTGGVSFGGSGGAATGGSGGLSMGGTGGGTTANCPAGTTEIDNGGQCMCAISCTVGDDTPCQGQGHCCDMSAYGYGGLCGADQQAVCDSVLGTACTGGTAGTGGTGGSTGSCPAGTAEVDNGGQCMCVVTCNQGDDSPCAVVSGGHCCDFSAYGQGFLCGGDQQTSCDSFIGAACP